MTDNACLVSNANDCDWEYIEGEEGRDDVMRWKTLIGGNYIAGKGITMGIFEIPVGNQLSVHHHAPQEAYHVYQGSGEVLIGEQLYPVQAGHSVYIPPNASHGIRNTGEEKLKLFWIFPTDTWEEIVYHMEGRRL